MCVCICLHMHLHTYFQVKAVTLLPVFDSELRHPKTTICSGLSRKNAKINDNVRSEKNLQDMHRVEISLDI